MLSVLHGEFLIWKNRLSINSTHEQINERNCSKKKCVINPESIYVFNSLNSKSLGMINNAIRIFKNHTH